MPVIVESITAPSIDDQTDLLKIYNDAPEWLKQAETPEEWLIRVLADENIFLYAGRFNDRLLAAALINRSQQQWSLEWLTVRNVTRNRGVGKRTVDVLQQMATENNATLAVSGTTEIPLPLWLQALRK